MNNIKMQRAKLIFDDRNVPISVQFDDPYYSFDNGLAESEYVFLAGNDLSDRLCDGFHIAELGFGTGLNFFLAWREWVRTGRHGKIYFTSFEAFPMSAEDRQKSLAFFPELANMFEQFMSFDGKHFENEEICLEVIHGDARATLPRWGAQADAWFLDGFSPAKNPELWQDDLLQAVGAHTCQSGTAATYSAAGFVRNGLAQAGFTVERVKGFGRKRHMSRAIKR